MEITLDKKDINNASININVVEADYSQQVDAQIKDHSKKAQLKGFRPGKVPPALIKRMMGKSLVADEVMKLINTSIRDYITDNKINIVGEPLPSNKDEYENIDWENDSEFKFSFDLGIIPDYEVEATSKLKVNKYVVEIDDKEIQETTERVLDSNGTSINPDTAAQGDIVSGNLKEVDGELEKEAFIPLDKLMVKSAKEFVGQKVGDTVTFDIVKSFKKDKEAIKLATGLTEEEIDAIKGEVSLDISKISRTEKAELNQELFDKVFGKDEVKSEEEFNAKLTEILTENYEKDAERKLMQDIQDKIIEKTKISLPEDFFKRWLLEVNKESLSEDKVNQDFPLYERELKWTVIRNKIAEEQKFEAGTEEVIEKAKAFLQAQYLGGMALTPEMEPQMMELVNKYLTEENGKNYQRIYEDVLNDKTINFLKGEISPKDKKVTAEEFKKLLA